MKALQMVPAECFGDREQIVPHYSFPEWLDEIVAADEYPASEEREHFLVSLWRCQMEGFLFHIGLVDQDLGVW